MAVLFFITMFLKCSLNSNFFSLIGLLFSIAALSDVDLSGENDIAFINSVSDVCNWHVTYLTLPAFFTAGVTACTKHDSSPPEIKEDAKLDKVYIMQVSFIEKVFRYLL